jgi:short-subunit dehydrogenase
MDQPEQVQPRAGERRGDLVQIKRDAAELAKLASEIPPAVEQANKGVLSKDLSDRLKRIEKLSKQLRRELYD